MGTKRVELNDSVFWCREFYRETVQLWCQVRDRKRAAKRKIKRILTMIENEVARAFPTDSDLVDPLEFVRTATVDESDLGDPDTLGWYAHMHAAIRAIGDQVKTDWRETERRAITSLVLIEKAIIYHVSESMALLGERYWQGLLRELEDGSIGAPPPA